MSKLMTRGKATGTILLAPILLGLLPFALLLLVLKLPMICCERRRAIQYLPWAGLAYCGVLIPLVAVIIGLRWWELLVVVGLFVLGGDWLLPDPCTYIFHPRKRRAVMQAINYLEAQQGPSVIYGMVRVIGSELGRTIVCVPIKTDSIPPARRFVAVGDESVTVEELDFEYVSSRHGVQVWR